MRRELRAVLVALAWVAVVALGLAYPVIMRGDAWREAKWLYWPWLFALAIVPVVVWRMTLGNDARVPRLGLGTIAPLLGGPRGWRTRLRDVPGILRGAALTLAILALARPQNTLRGETSEESGIDIVVALDLSGSMAAVMESPSQIGAQQRRAKRPTRIETAKDVLIDFISRRKSDRIGVVCFALNAYILSPPTLDYGLLVKLVRKIELGAIDWSKTAIGDAVGTSVARLRRSDARSKAVILLTDGDSNAGEVSPEYATSLARAQNVRIYTVQIGDGNDVDVEVDQDVFGQPIYQKKHYPVNPELLHKMALATGGEAFIATDRDGLEKSFHSILDRLEKSRFVAGRATVEDLFPFLLLPAVALVVLEALVRLVVVRRFP